MRTATNREERKILNEQCFYCCADDDRVFEGEIVNESASGVLLKAGAGLEEQQPVCVLPLIYGESLELGAMGVDELIEHPMSRWGKVVRVDSGGRAGIQFESSQKHAQFSRWFRGDSAVVTLFFQRSGVLTLSGTISIETAALVHSILGKADEKVADLLICAQQAEEVVAAAVPLIRGALKAWLRSGKILTVVGGAPDAKIAQTWQGLDEPNLHAVSLGDAYGVAPYSANGKAAARESAGDASAPRDNSFLIVTRGKAALSRLAGVLKRNSVKPEAAAGAREALIKIEKLRPRFVVVDFELEDANSLIILNQLKESGLEREPELVLIGPRHIEALARAALYLRTVAYISKPCPDREILSLLETLIKKGAAPIPRES